MIKPDCNSYAKAMEAADRKVVNLVKQIARDEMLTDYRMAQKRLQEYKDKEFPVGAVVHIAGVYGEPEWAIVGFTDGCPTDALPLLFESGNIWFRPLENCHRIRNMQDVPKSIRRLKLACAGIKTL